VVGGKLELWTHVHDGFAVLTRVAVAHHYLEVRASIDEWVKHLNFPAGNIRNVWSPEHVYPSDLYLEGQISDSGWLLLDGQANFLAEPQMALVRINNL
jgi:hypothetical protein